MSYILEAIRRSDEERRKRLVPSVSTIHAVTPQRSGLGPRTTIAGVAVAGAVVVLAVGVGARWWPGAQPVDPAQQPVARVQPEPAQQPVARVQPEPAAAPAPEADTDSSIPAPAGGNDVADRDPVTAMQSRSDDPPVLPAPAPKPATVPEIAASEPLPAASGNTVTEKRTARTPYSPVAVAPHIPQPSALDPRGLTRPAEPAEPGGVDPALRPEPSPPAAEMVRALAVGDLPDPVRRSLPDIAISLHRYADNPAARMIRVNGRVGREGEAVAEDLTIAEITRTGVVFATGEERFYMDAFQNWQARSGS